MRNTKYKPFFDPILTLLHQQMDICGIVRNHFIALSRRYYRRYGKGLSYKQMSAHLTKLKKLEKYQHWNIPYAWSLQQVIRDLARSYREMKTLGRGRPRFKKAKNHRGIRFDGSQVELRLVLPEQKGHRKYPVYELIAGGMTYRFSMHRRVVGKIKRVAFTRDAIGEIYLTISEDFVESVPEPKTGKAEGFDIGIKDFLTGANGKKYKSPMFYKQNEKKLAKEQRCLSRKVKGSNNYERQRKVVGRIHIKTANQRSEHHWKLSVKFCRSFDVMIFEDLNIAAMKALWGKIVSDLSFSSFLNKLQHQTNKRNRIFHKIGRWVPTTKPCSVCGYKNESLTLSDRHWMCPDCGTHLDRDHNAAVNILREGLASLGLGDVSPTIVDKTLVGCTVESSSLALKSTSAFA